AAQGGGGDGRRGRRLGEGRQARKGLGRIPLDREDAGVAELEPERDGQLGEHLPRLLERLGDRYRRAQELNAALEVGVAALLLGKGGGREQHRRPAVRRTREVIPGGQELHGGRDPRRGRRPPAEQRLHAVQG